MKIIQRQSDERPLSPVLKASTDLANRIASLYPSLSAGHRKAADFVLEHPLDTATMTIEGLAEKSGASTATVTRFVRALGFSGYGEFRASLSEALKHAMAPVRSLADAHGVPASPYATLIDALKDQAANLDAAIEALDESTVSRATKLLLGANRIFVIGAGASHHVASFLEDGLALYLEADVIFATARGGPSRAMRHMLSAGPRDLVIAISMPRYSRTTLELCGFAQKREVPILALTDSLTSPLAGIADLTFFAPAGSRLLPNSPSAIFALADALITLVARERPDAVEALKDLSENLLWSFHR
jgi:DNA-binding MurR/RpiR family transcriptional regulator